MGVYKMLVLNCQKMLEINCHFLLESTCRLHFVDPDDYISDDFYYLLISCIEKEGADMCQCQWLAVMDEREKILKQGITFRERNDYAIVLEYIGSLWDKVYRRELFENARFDENLELFEDVEIFSKILLPDINHVFADGGTYFYRVRKKSLSHRFYTIDSYRNLVHTCTNLKKYYEDSFDDICEQQDKVKKLEIFKINAKASMFVNNYFRIKGEHVKRKTNKSILYDMCQRMHDN